MTRPPSFHLALPDDLRAQVATAAQAAGLTSTAWIQRAIRESLGHVCPTCGKVQVPVCTFPIRRTDQANPVILEYQLPDGTWKPFPPTEKEQA